MLNFSLLKNILIIAIASGIITTSLVQKIKESFRLKKSNRFVIISFIISMTIGTLFALSFSDASIIDALWIGLFSFIDADTLYKMFEEKIFTPYSALYENKTIQIPVENNIERGD